MPTLEAIKRKIKSGGDLLGVVKTMKVLAAVNIRQYQKAVASLVEYNRTVELGLHVVLKDRLDLTTQPSAPPVTRCGAIVWGSDQGLCGPLNRQIVAHALAGLDALGLARDQRVVMAIGARAGDALAAAGQGVAETLTPPAALAGITPLVQELILRFEDWHARRGLDGFFLYYTRYHAGAAAEEPATVQLLPLDPAWLRELVAKKWESRVIPVYTMDRDRLFSDLVREYLFVGLYRAFAESLASENAARLAAMQRAEKNIGEFLQELQGQFHRQRQMVITEELLDIVSGFEALAAP